MTFLKIILTVPAAILVLNISAQEESVGAKRIEDNSFLIEEAYNQEEGVVQHISNFQYMKNNQWFYSFTQEWPVPKQAHQLSATVLFFNAGSSTGIGDVLINYRYQAILNKTVSFSPRFSLILPTGNYKINTGTGTFGYQVSLPVSLTFSRKIVMHYNLGTTLTFGAKDAEGLKTNTYLVNYGIRLIWLTAETFNLMLEAVGYTTFPKSPGNPARINNFFLLNPGFRYAFNFRSGLQIVPGLAVPVSIAPADGSFGIFVYLSFEGPVWKGR